MIVKSALTLLEKHLAQSASAVDSFAEAARGHLEGDARQDASVPLRVLQDGLALVEEAHAGRRRIRRYLEAAHAGIDKAADLTRRLLAFARRQPLSPKSLQLDVLIRGMQSLLEHSVEPNIRFHYQLNSRWHVLCDANQMESAILNLVINARDAMPSGGDITIRTADVRLEADAGSGLQAGDHVQLRVADTGVGMSEEVRSRAFDPFFTTKPVGKGTGLGLSTILGFVLQSNGRLSIDSELGMGASIDIVLPRHVSSVAAQIA
ncbi:MAG TPA: ATP-binding protein [Rhodanobacteraceae bacterium]